MDPKHIFMRYTSILLFALAFTTLSSFGPGKKLTITSRGFTDKGRIPKKYTCDGGETSPPLHLNNLPSDTKSIAIIVHDPDAPMKGGFTHWVVWNIEPTMLDIPENFKGGVVGLNGAGEHSYKGMCPPEGTHKYHFMVYALDAKLDIGKDIDKDKLQELMKSHILAEGELMGKYIKTANAMKK